MSEPGTPDHRLACQLHLPALTVELDVLLEAPWTVLFGPSASGKSTLLRAAAGLLPASASATLLRRDAGGQWQDLSSLAPENRGIGYAPQAGSLFPHLSVRQNIFFANSCRGSGQKASATERAQAAIDLCQLAPLLGRSPGSLSGGERQRVSLARALAVPDAQLLLLDEPLSAVDRPLRLRTLPRLRELARHFGVSVISVTHDIEETFVLDAEVLQLAKGHLQYRGAAAEVLAAERTALLRSLGADR